MKRPVKDGILAIAISLGVVAGAISALGAPQGASPEPVYGGTALSDWVVALEKYDSDEVGYEPPVNAMEFIALRTIGAGAVPHLLKWLAVPQIMDQPPTKPSREEVVMAFRVLGSQCESAIPGLAKMANDLAHRIVTATNQSWEIGDDEDQFKNVVTSLANLGPAAMPVMLTLAASLRGQDLQLEVIKAFEEAGTNGTAAVPALIAWHRDKDSRVQDAALEALVVLQQAPEVVLPALLAGLKDPDSRYEAALQLGFFGSAARPAVPDLIELMDDPDVNIREQGNLFAWADWRAACNRCAALLAKQNA